MTPFVVPSDNIGPGEQLANGNREQSKTWRLFAKSYSYNDRDSRGGLGARDESRFVQGFALRDGLTVIEKSLPWSTEDVTDATAQNRRVYLFACWHYDTFEADCYSSRASGRSLPGTESMVNEKCFGVQTNCYVSQMDSGPIYYVSLGHNL